MLVRALFVCASVWVARGAVLAPDSPVLGLTLDELRAKLGTSYEVALEGPGGPFSGTSFTVTQGGTAVYGGAISPPDVGTIALFGVPYTPVCE